jgi:hypothetical protein
MIGRRFLFLLFICWYSIFYSQNIPGDVFDQLKKEKKEKEFPNNIVFLNTLEFINRGIGVSYIRELFDQRLHIYMPVSTSFARPSFSELSIFTNNLGSDAERYEIEKKIIDAGIGINFHTAPESNVTHFIGPLYRYLYIQGHYHHLHHGGITGSPIPYKVEANYIMLNNGLLIRVGKHFSMMTNLAIGSAKHTWLLNQPCGGCNTEYPFRKILFQAGFHLGYRF